MSNKICDFLCLPSLFSIIFLKFVKSTAYFRTLFLFTADWYYIVANLFCLHIDQLDIWVISTFDYCEWFCCDYMCTGIRFSTCFQFFGCVFRIITTESYGYSVFKVLRNCYTVFLSSGTTLHSHQQCIVTF